MIIPPTVAAAGLILPEHIVEGQITREKLPLMLTATPEMKDDGVAWMSRNRAFLEASLLAFGAILLRGFKVNSAELFADFAKALAPELETYTEPSSPRSRVHQEIYTSTDYPEDQWIHLHNEMSYSSTWPRIVLFCCIQPSATQGATPIASSSRVYNRIRADVRQRFEERGVMYVRNFGKSFGMTWQHFFSTDSRTQVEAYCAKAGISCEWGQDGSLRTWQTRPATAIHHKSGEKLWFNQAHAFHESTLDPDVRAMLREDMAPMEMVRNAFYGDGSPIGDEDIEVVQEAYRQEMHAFAWEKGDVMILENMKVAHGRMPFTGPRKVLVAMAGLLS